MEEALLRDEMLLMFSGWVAGCIDSIAGGGGLITLPTLAGFLEPGPHSIGTNKIVGFTGALIAFLVYLRKHPLHLRRGAAYVAVVGLGALLGSWCSPFFPKVYFRYLLIAACPLVLWVIWNKQAFMNELRDPPGNPLFSLMVSGVAVGFYDGFFGPGGGTFMLLSLLMTARLPLFEALLLSKLANTASAGVSLVSYGLQGYVHPRYGMIMAVGMTLGGYMGASLASRKAEKVVRPVLALVVAGLLAIQFREAIHSH
jgi:uncharacterized membrane protein YfcA